MPPPVHISCFQIMPSPTPGYYSRYALRQSAKTVGYVHVIADGNGTKEIWTLYTGSLSGGNAAYVYPSPGGQDVTTTVVYKSEVLQATVEAGAGTNPDSLSTQNLTRIQATCRSFSPGLIHKKGAVTRKSAKKTAAKKPSVKKPTAKKPAAKAKKKAKK